MKKTKNKRFSQNRWGEHSSWFLAPLDITKTPVKLRECLLFEHTTSTPTILATILFAPKPFIFIKKSPTCPFSRQVEQNYIGNLRIRTSLNDAVRVMERKSESQDHERSEWQVFDFVGPGIASQRASELQRVKSPLKQKRAERAARRNLRFFHSTQLQKNLVTL